MKESDLRMEFYKQSCEDFIETLASSAPVPGGGGASALVGAVGVALGNMVANLTIGKKKYAASEADLIELREKAYVLQKELLLLIDKDAEGFEPLANAYRLPKETEEEKAYKEKVMEEALKEAAAVPMEIMEKICEAIKLHKEFAGKGSVLAISDAGVGVSFCRGALLGASLNVFINTKSMKDRECAEELNRKAEEMLAIYVPMADEIFAGVKERLV